MLTYLTARRTEVVWKIVRKKNTHEKALSSAETVFHCLLISPLAHAPHSITLSLSHSFALSPSLWLSLSVSLSVCSSLSLCFV